jgi:hypothetical protein
MTLKDADVEWKRDIREALAWGKGYSRKGRAELHAKMYGVAGPGRSPWYRIELFPLGHYGRGECHHGLHYTGDLPFLAGSGSYRD